MIIPDQLLYTVVGFLFSLLLFYLTEELKKRQSKKHLVGYVKKELDYNIDFLRCMIEDFEKLARQIALTNRPLSAIFKFDRLQFYFTHESFKGGLFYDSLDSDVLKELAEMLFYFDPSMNRVHYQYLNEYNQGLTQPSIFLQSIEYNKGLIEKYIKLQNHIRSRIG